MFSDDRFMTMATGLVLAIAVGAMAQNSGALMAFFTGEVVTAGQDDQFTIRAGKNQVLDVLANDTASGTVKLLDSPMCGTVRPTVDNGVEYVDSGACSGTVSFSYCVKAEGECEPYEVVLNVVNQGGTTQTASTPIADVPEVIASTPSTASSAVIELETVMVELETQDIEIETQNPEPTSTARINVQGDRQTPGQILLEDDSSDIVIAGFNSDSAPSLFTPNMEELIQPQESVAILRRSTEVLSPSRIDADESLQTQTSTRTTAQTSGVTMQAAPVLGTEASPMVAFAAPSQPSLMRAPQLGMAVPASPSFVSIGTETHVIERGPDADSRTPTLQAVADVRSNDLIAPANSNTTNTALTVYDMVVASVSGVPANADLNAAQTGDVMVSASKPGASAGDGNDVTLNATDGSVVVASLPTLGTSSDTAVVGTGPEINAISSNGFGSDEITLDDLVASVLDEGDTSDAGYLDTLTFDTDTIAVVQSAGVVENIENQSAAVGEVSIAAADPADSSDIVVEMAVQILLPSTLLNDEATRALSVSTVPNVLLTDKMFTANLEVSTPPTAEEMQVASIAPVVPTPIQPNTNARCDVDMSASARPGAAISVFVNSPCRAGQVLTLTHSDFSFSTRLDGNGTLSVTIPAFANLAVLSATFDDGGFAESRLIVRDANEMERLAVIWNAAVDLDINAFEDGAREGSDGHVWENHPRTYRDTLTGGGGFLEVYGDSTIAGGTMAEVYSLPTSRIREQTSVSMNLNINAIGNSCGSSMLLSTVRVENRGEVSNREFSLALPDCSTASAGVVLENFVSAISVARR